MANPYDQFKSEPPSGATTSQQKPAAPADERSLGERFLRGVELGTRDVIEGAAALPGLAYDIAAIPQNVVNWGVKKATGTDLGLSTKSGGEYISQGLTAASQGLTAAGLPEAETDAERLSSGVIRGASGALAGSATGFIPGLAVAAPTLVNALTTNLPTQIAAGAAAGGAGEATHQAGGGPLTQAGASLLAGLSTAGAAQALKAGWAGANALLAPFFRAGQEGVATDVLLRGSSAPNTLLPRLEEGASNPRLPNSPVTTAQQARDPGLLVIESGQRSDAVGAPGSVSPAARFRDVDAQRNTARTDALKEMADTSDPSSRGFAVRTALEEGEDAMKAEVSRRFRAAEPKGGGAYPIDNIKQAAKEATAKFSKERMGGGVPEELQAVIDDIAAAPNGTMTFDQIQNVRSRLGKIAGMASREGDDRLAGAAGQIMKSLEDEADSPAWQEAIRARRDMGAAVDRDEGGASATGRILREDRYGRPIMSEEKVADTALSSVGNLRQTLSAMDKALGDARAANLPPERIAALEEHVRTTRRALQGQFVDNLIGSTKTTGQIADAAGNVSTVLSPASFATFMEQNAAIASELFTPGQLANLRTLAADFAETSMAQTTAKVAGSNTVQNLSVGNLLARASRGLIDPGNPLMQTVAGLGPVMKWIYAAPESRIREILTEAMVNPQFAQALLERASPEAMQRAMGYVEKTMGARWKAAAIQAGERQGVRTTESEANRQTTPRYNFDVRPNRLGPQ